ncbi:MAG: TrmH family RNA methyltransferase [Candidatus Obscuribacterales bacterium]
MTFEALEDFEMDSGSCPHCGQPMTARLLSVLDQTERQYRKHLAAGTACAENFPDPGDQQSALLEDVRSLWNVGSIFRSSDGAGLTTLYLTGITGCPPRKEIAKTSLGAEENVRWRYHWNSLSVLKTLKQHGVLLLGLERTAGSQPLNQFRLQPGQRVCLIVGNEVSGLSQEALSVCDVVCDLPMHGVKESLNVAVAFGIAAYFLNWERAHPT